MRMTQRSRILLVDDDQSILELVDATLCSDGTVETLLATDGKAAIDMVRTWKPRLVFLDINMPNVNGYEVCQSIKGDPATAKTMVVMLSGRSSENDRRKALEFGADDFITKPFSPAELFHKFQRILVDLKRVS